MLKILKLVCQVTFFQELSGKSEVKDQILERHNTELTPPTKTNAMTAAASITQDKGFHMKLRNFSTLFSCHRTYIKGEGITGKHIIGIQDANNGDLKW